MAKKRKGGEMPNIHEHPRVTFDRNETMKLTKVAEPCDFSYLVCYKAFTSPQALGGHQNAHRHQRSEEEKECCLRDPIPFGKRGFLHALRSRENSEVAPNPSLNLNAAAKMCSSRVHSRVIDAVNGGDRETDVINFFPPKELSLAESVGVNADEEDKGKACIDEYNIAGYGVNFDGQNLDLTHKL